MTGLLRIGLVSVALFVASIVKAQIDTILSYHIEMSGNASSGHHAPLWFTANRNGLASQKTGSGFLRAGLSARQNLKRGWCVAEGLDLAAAVNSPRDFVVQQAYVDLSWRILNLSVGSKERTPLGKNYLLSSGGLVEGNNVRPVPQVRMEIADYYAVPGTKGWLAFKGHIAYGRFTDDRWQRDFARVNNGCFVEDVLYHSKALMLKVGNKDVFPVEAELGMLMSTQFGGKQHKYTEIKNDDGTVTWKDEVTMKLPHGLKSYVKAFLAQAGGVDSPVEDQVNVEGNHIGSWNFTLNYYLNDWKFRVYYEHMFEDHSQMFLQYGRWKDGHLGIEITLPKNRWVSTLLWEGLATKDQSGPILYDGGEQFAQYNPAFLGYQISANDNYYNHYFYMSWQHYGMAMGNPLLISPIYNGNGDLTFRSSRMRAHHWAFCGEPSEEWTYRVLMSYALHWGTYMNPLDKIANQFSSLYEVTYSPKVLNGWRFSLSAAVDHGSYLVGNTAGGMITIKKEGIWRTKK